MADEKKIQPVSDDDTWVSEDDLARILGLTKPYAGENVRKGFLKGRIGYRSYSGRNFQYNLGDIKRVLEQATVPAKKH